MEKEFDLNELAKKYDLPIEFVTMLHEKVVDKENFERALKMYVDGLMKYEIATGKDPIVVADIRHEVASNFQAQRNRIALEMEKQRVIGEYYTGCKALKYPSKPNASVSDVVFIKDGHLVAFAHFEPKQGGIYAANNEVMPNFNWQPHKWLGVLRQKNKAFYRDVKKAATNSPREWFDFNLKTE